MSSTSPPPTPPARPPQVPEDYRFHKLGTPCEWAESYHPGGLHPVHLGDVFNQRYEVIRKLGYGAFATIWLAVDKETSRYVALKIVVAGSDIDSSKELDTMKTIASCADDGPSRPTKSIVQLIDSFTHHGPNGNHLCLVMEPMGSSVSEVINDFFGARRLSVATSKSVLRQILHALCFLHEHGIVHGDLQPGNILFAIRDLDTVPVEQLRQNASNARIDHLRRRDGKDDKWAPRYLVVAGPLNGKTVTMSDDEVKLADFGGAFRVTDPPESVVTPLELRAPETIFGCRPGPAIDIWSLGCLLYMFLIGNSMVEMLLPFDGEEVVDDEHLIELNDILGPLPAHLRSKWPRAHQYFGENGERLPAIANIDAVFDRSQQTSGEPEVVPEDPPTARPNLRALFHEGKPNDISDEEEEEIVKLLQLMLRYDPSERPTARDLLDHPWIKE